MNSFVEGEFTLAGVFNCDFWLKPRFCTKSSQTESGMSYCEPQVSAETLCV